MQTKNYTEKDLVKVARYMISDKRGKRLSKGDHPLPLPDRIKSVTDADIRNALAGKSLK